MELMRNMVTDNSTRPLSRRVKPTLDTRFHIDYTWWEREDRELRTYLISHLLPEQRAQFENNQDTGLIDAIDPETAEVRRVDALQQALAKAAHDPQYITEHTTLVDAVFRVFLANGNKPLSPDELGKLINRSPATILRTMSGAQVYKGIRPLLD
jgi:hypothetical protein